MTAHSIFQNDYSGELLEGIFYELDIPLSIGGVDFLAEYSPSKQKNQSILNDHSADAMKESQIYGTVHYRQHRNYQCPLDSTHEISSVNRTSEPYFVSSGEKRDNYWIELFNGPYVPKFVYDMSGLTVVVNRAFRDEILQSDLLGVVPLPLSAPSGFNQSVVKYPDLYYLECDGRSCYRRPKVVPPSPNECPFCGWGPVVCPSCQHVEWNCPECKNRLVVPLVDHQGVGDKRFAAPGAPPRGWVINGREWDGSDVFPGPVQAFVTGRFVNFALRCNAASFVAKSCLVDISECNIEQIERLENRSQKDANPKPQH